MANLPSASSPKLWGTAYNEYLRVEHNVDGIHGTITDLITKGPTTDLRSFLPDGFVSDGSVDYTTEIQAAVDFGPAVLLVPEGTWACNLSVDGKVNIVGLGPESKLKAFTSSPVITVTERITGGALGRRFQDLTIDGNGKTSIGILYTALTVEEETIRIAFQNCTRGIDWGVLGAIGNTVRYCNFITCDYGIYAKDSGGSAIALNLNTFTENRFRSITLCGIYLNGTVVGCSGNGFNDNWMEGIDGFAFVLRGKSTIDEVTYPNHFSGGWYENVAATTPITLDDEGSVTSYVIWIENTNAVSSNGIFPSDVLIDSGVLSIDYYKGTGPIGSKSQLVSAGTAEVSINDAYLDSVGTAGVVGSPTGSLVIKRPHSTGGDNRGFLVESLPAINNDTSHENLTSIADLTAISGASLTYQDAQFLGSAVRRIALSDNTERADSSTLVLTDDKYYAISFSIKGSSSTETDITLTADGAGTFYSISTIMARGDRWTHYVGAVYGGTGGGFATSQTFRFGTGTTATFDISRFQLVEFDTIVSAEAFLHSQSYSVGQASTKFNTLANDATPKVITSESHSFWLTGGATTITDFDDGFIGQTITVIAEHSLTITEGTPIVLKGSANFTMTDTDTLTLVQKPDGNWYEMSRGDNGA